MTVKFFDPVGGCRLFPLAEYIRGQKLGLPRCSALSSSHISHQHWNAVGAKRLTTGESPFCLRP